MNIRIAALIPSEAKNKYHHIVQPQNSALLKLLPCEIICQHSTVSLNELSVSNFIYQNQLKTSIYHSFCGKTCQICPFQLP